MSRSFASDFRAVVGAAALLVAAAAASSAAAVSVVFTPADTAVGSSKTVNFGGSVSGNAAASNALAASLNLKLTAIDGNVWKFNYTLSNLSNAGWTDNRVSVFGFRGVAPNNFSSVQLKSGIFDVLTSAQTGVPQNNALQLDFCAKADGNNSCNNGQGGVKIAGASIPNTTSWAAGSATGSIWFTGLSNTQMKFDNFYVRYQSLDGFGERGGSGIGEGSSITTITTPIPEPGTWALMIGGFGLVGGALRRRQLASAAA